MESWIIVGIVGTRGVGSGEGSGEGRGGAGRHRARAMCIERGAGLPQARARHADTEGSDTREHHGIEGHRRRISGRKAWREKEKDKRQI